MHIFDPKDLAKLDSLERNKIINPAEVLTSLGLKKGQKMLDFGVGTGFFARQALEITGEKGFLYGADISDEMLLAASSKLTGLNNFKLIKINGKTIPLESGSIDFAFMGFVLHEIEDKKPVLEEIKRLLVPGGILGIVEWDNRNFEKGPPEKERLSKEETKDILVSCNFIILNTCEYSEYHYYVAAVK